MCSFAPLPRSTSPQISAIDRQSSSSLRGGQRLGTGKRQFWFCQSRSNSGNHNMCIKTRGRPSLANTRIEPEDTPEDHQDQDHLEGQAQCQMLVTSSPSNLLSLPFNSLPYTTSYHILSTYYHNTTRSLEKFFTFNLGKPQSSRQPGSDPVHLHHLQGEHHIHLQHHHLHLHPVLQLKNHRHHHSRPRASPSPPSPTPSG